MQQSHPGLPILALTLRPQASAIRRLLAMGVCGCLTKDISARELVAAVRAVMAGMQVLSPTVAEKLLGNEPGQAFLRAHGALTRREREVLTLLLEGLKHREIAEQLHISEQVVRNYASSIYAKLGVRSRAELTALLGRVTPDRK